MAEPTVRMSGIVLASLMFQHVNSDSDVEGLVLGESRFEEQVTISDSQADQIHIEEIYNVQKHIACPRPNHFYSSVGDVDLDSVRSLLADNKQESVIGWYRQRRNSEQQMTLRERAVHERLQAALSNPHIVFLLLTPSRLTAAGSTHRMEYAAFTCRRRRFLHVPVLVSNLGGLEQLAYWRGAAPCAAAGYNLAVKKHGSKFFSSNGLLRDVTEVNKMNESLQAELQKACSDVEESERLVETLQADVSALRRRLKEEQQRGAAGGAGGGATDGEPPPPRRNLRLHDAVRATLAAAPLLHTQTLTLQGFPVPDVPACCGAERDEDVPMATQTQRDAQDALGAEPRADRTNRRKRPRETQPAAERKRRKSSS